MFRLSYVINPAVNNFVGNMDSYVNTPAFVLQTFITNLITLAISIGGLYFFVMLILGGYAYITAGSDKEGVQKATSRIKNALIGIAILLSIYTIMWIVEAVFGVSLRNIIVPTLNST